MENYVDKNDSEIRVQNKFMAKVYAWMAFALFLSAAAAFGTAFMAYANHEFARTLLSFGYIVLALVELILVWWLTASIRKISVFSATIGFLTYSILNGITLSSIFFVYRLDSIANIFVITALMFTAMSIYGAKTKQNLMSFGRYFTMGIIGIVIASVFNIFMRSSSLSWGISLISVVLFTGLTAYDSQKMMKVSQVARNDEVFAKASIVGALELYLDFINIFLSLLRLFGRRN